MLKLLANSLVGIFHLQSKLNNGLNNLRERDDFSVSNLRRSMKNKLLLCIALAHLINEKSLLSTTFGNY